jgi:hypothetical protein
MSATTVDGTALLSLPGRILRPPVRVSILIVVIWHVVAALAFAWIAYNIFGAVWKLDSLPRTIIGIGASVGIVANLGAAVLLVRSNRRGRMASFTVNYLTLIFVIVLLFQSLDLASYLDDFAASFNQAFLPFIGLAIAVAWIVVARRRKARRAHTAPADAPLRCSRSPPRCDGSDSLPLSCSGLAWLWLLKPWTCCGAR